MPPKQTVSRALKIGMHILCLFNLIVFPHFSRLRMCREWDDLFLVETKGVMKPSPQYYNSLLDKAISRISTGNLLTCAGLYRNKLFINFSIYSLLSGLYFSSFLCSYGIIWFGWAVLFST